MQVMINELEELYAASANLSCLLGALQRAEEESEHYEELKNVHIHEMAGSLALAHQLQDKLTDDISCILERVRGF